MAQVKTLAAKPDPLEHTSVKCYAPKQGLEKYLIRGKHGNFEKLDLSFKERGTNFLALITVYSVHMGGACTSQHVCGGQKATCSTWSSASTCA